MKKINKIAGLVFAAVTLCFVLQSCAAKKSQYGCPERIQTPVSASLVR